MYMADNMQQFKEKLSYACKAGPHAGKTQSHSEMTCVQCSCCGVSEHKESLDCGAPKPAERGKSPGQACREQGTSFFDFISCCRSIQCQSLIFDVVVVLE